MAIELEGMAVDASDKDAAFSTSASDDAAVYDGIRDVLERARRRTASTVNREMVLAYWDVGRLIHEAVGERAEYGKRLVEYLSERLTREFGRGFGRRNLFQMRKFYEMFPIVQTVSAQLSWSHYCVLVRIDDEQKRRFYMNECIHGNWGVRRLEREIHTLCYERALAAGSLHASKGSGEPTSREPFPLKDPYVLDFLGLPDSSQIHETDLEQALISHIQEFLLELGTGFAFVGRQMRVSSELSDYYVDLVFYHVRLKCYVLVDLKSGKLEPRDIGQMDFYVRLFDATVATDNDNPTVGIVLCAEGDRAVARYSALADGRGLFAARYVTALPTEDELASAIESAMT